jgi:hypothetical protein
LPSEAGSACVLPGAELPLVAGESDAANLCRIKTAGFD